MPLTLSNTSGVGSFTLVNNTSSGRITLSVTASAAPVADQLRAQLSTSSGSYDAATVNNWVKITKTEYDRIAANITGATILS